MRWRRWTPRWRQISGNTVGTVSRCVSATVTMVSHRLIAIIIIIITDVTIWRRTPCRPLWCRLSRTAVSTARGSRRPPTMTRSLQGLGRWSELRPPRTIDSGPLPPRRDMLSAAPRTLRHQPQRNTAGLPIPESVRNTCILLELYTWLDR